MTTTNESCSILVSDALPRGETSRNEADAVLPKPQRFEQLERELRHLLPA